jgi:hypothetical protein
MTDPHLSRERLYQEIRADIRATDEISFKLLGLVPLVSGAAFLTFFFEDKVRAQPHVVVTLSLFAALITLGLFRWELRNIQTCSWLLRCSEAMEEEAAGIKPARPKPPRGFGKTEAEKGVYSVTILTWLLMPAVVCPLHQASALLLACYVIVALFTAGLTVQSAATSVRVAPSPLSAPETRASGGDAAEPGAAAVPMNVKPRLRDDVG